MLSIEDLSFVADNKKIIDNISFNADKGKLIAITGPNGSGKSTLAKIIAGLEIPTQGKIVLDGIDITNMDITSRAKLGIGFAFQQPVRFKGISVSELLNIANEKPLTTEEMTKYLNFVGLEYDKYADREVDKNLSGGEIKRIELASVLVRKSKLFIFDEPEAGVDIWSFKSIIRVFNELKKQQDTTVIVISHQEKILSISDEIVIIDNGKIVCKGCTKDIYPQLNRNFEKCSKCCCNINMMENKHE